MLKLYPSIILFLIPFCTFAQSVDVINDTPSGIYENPIYITLTPTDVGAKTFYSLKPDGSPNDAVLYTGPVLLKHSSPFIYFSFISTSNESKIKQNDYTISYPSTIAFSSSSISSSGSVTTKIINEGSKNVNIGFWSVQSESSTIVIPEGIILTPSMTYEVRIPYEGTSAIALRSPDDDEKDVFIPQSSGVGKTDVPPKKKSIVTKVVPRKIISINELPLNPTQEVLPPTNFSNPETTIDSITVDENTNSAVPTMDNVSPNNIPKRIVPLDINKIMKASVVESDQIGTNSFYLLGILVVSMGVGLLQWFIRKKQK